jgi:hypothetical protein
VKRHQIRLGELHLSASHSWAVHSFFECAMSIDGLSHLGLNSVVLDPSSFAVSASSVIVGVNLLTVGLNACVRCVDVYVMWVCGLCVCV